MNGSIATSQRNRAVRKYIGGLFLACAPAVTGLAYGQTVLPADAKALCPVSASAFNGWFVNGSPSLNGAVNPANSLAFPNTGDCSFYQWSEQMFLWLTSPAPASYGGGNSLVITSPVFFNVSGKNESGQRTYTQNTPGVIPPILNVRSAQAGPNGLQRLITKNGTAFEVLPAPLAASGRSMIRDSTGKFVEIDHIDATPGKKPTFFAANKKAITLPAVTKLDPTLAARVAPHLLNLSATASKNFVQGFRNGPKGGVVFIDSQGNAIEPTQGQAGGLSGVLLAQNGSLVYYATMVNDVFAYYQTGVTNGAITSNAGFSTNNFLTNQAGLTATVNYAATKGVTFPDANALTMEIKTSWIETTNLNTANYITTTASVPVYNTTSSALWIPTGAFKSVNLALVGMHVVGSANGHPEMIWATFEHVTNSPNAAYSYTNTANATVQVPQSASGTWLFSSTNSQSASYNVQKANYSTPPNITANTNQTIVPSDTIRWKAFGSASNATSPNPTLENTEVISSNNSVRGQLTAGDVRGNYIMTGATWTIGGASPTSSNMVGTNLLSNTTMETYDQGTNTQATGTSNCLLSCHQTNTTGVSHIFSSLIPLFPN